MKGDSNLPRMRDVRNCCPNLVIVEERWLESLSMGGERGEDDDDQKLTSLLTTNFRRWWWCYGFEAMTVLLGSITQLVLICAIRHTIKRESEALMSIVCSLLYSRSFKAAPSVILYRERRNAPVPGNPYCMGALLPAEVASS